MTALDTQTQADSRELVELAAKIRAWQTARDMTTAELVRRYPAVGSDKTYSLIRAGTLTGLDIDRWLTSYRSAWAVMESVGAREEVAEALFDDLTPALLVRRAFAELMAEQSITRVLLVEGDSGSGKSSAVASLQRKYGQRVVLLEASDAWGESPAALLGMMLSALGVRDVALTAAGRLMQVQRRLREARTCVAIDEAHHLRPRTLNTLKTVLNTTPGEVILLTLPNLWSRLETEAYVEVLQLTGNRLSERIVLGELREGDAAKLLERLASVRDRAAVRLVVEAARRRGRGNLQFVRQVALRVRAMDITGEPSAENVKAAIGMQLQRRGEPHA